MLLSAKDIAAIEEKIGYTFGDKSLLEQAFTRTSFCNEESAVKGGEHRQSNEVLEFFGDSILSASIVTFLIKSRSERYRYGVRSDLCEGDFSNIRSKLSDKRNLSDNIRRLGLQEYLIMGKGDRNLGISEEDSVAEDLFESIIGAVYIDADYSVGTVMRVLTNMLDMSVYLEKDKKPPIQSFKNALQEWCADKARKLPPPVYKKIHEEGPDHNKTYVCACYIGNKKLSEGSGRNVKKAESLAAKEALEILMREEK